LGRRREPPPQAVGDVSEDVELRQRGSLLPDEVPGHRAADRGGRGEAHQGGGMSRDVVVCPACSTRNDARFLQEIALHRSDILQCDACYSLYKEKQDGTLVPLNTILEKIHLGDDLISAVSPDTIAGEAILQAVDLFYSQQTSVTLV